jgi:alpha-tubulin suppressor-like RCC1 family protein
VFTPIEINKGFDGKRVVDAACGEEFSVILTENIRDGLQEVYSCGNNLRGQLGINRVCHLNDLTMIEDISGFVD